MAFFYELKVTGNLKTFNQIMVSLKFHDCICNQYFIEVEKYGDDRLIVNINYGNDDQYNICLDKSTAIKLSKELRKQIALLD